MTLVSVTKGTAIVGLTIDEMITMNNALNEVCNGIEVPEFHTRMGASHNEVRALMNSFGNAIGKARQRNGDANL